MFEINVFEKVRSMSFVKMELFGVIIFIFCVVFICLIFDFDKDRLFLIEVVNLCKYILCNILKMK